jgi:hypothetical protein
MAATEHIIKIRLQFDDMSQSEQEKARAGISGPVTKGLKETTKELKKGIDEGGEELGMLQDKWGSFDWAHPIMGIKNMWAATMEGMESKFGKVAMGIAGLVGGIIWRALKRAVDVQDQLVHAFVQLPRSIEMGGKTITNFGAKIAEAEAEIGRVAMTVGAPVTEIAQLFTALAKQRVPTQDLETMTQLSFLGAKALGANVDQMGQFLGMLRVQGKLSTQQLGTGPTGLLGNLTRIQNATGITETEMSGLLTQISKTAQYMAGWGSSAQDIENMAEATAKLTGMFGKLGLGAERAGEIMDKLMDPTQIGENAMMIRQMGLSMQEYMNMLKGGAVDQEKLTMGLVKSAQAGAAMAKNVNPFAAQQIAVMRGFKNVTEMQRIAQDGAKSMEDMKNGVVDFNQKAAEGMSSIKDQWGKLKGTMQGAMMPLFSQLMGVLTNVFTAIGKVILDHGKEINDFFKMIGDKLKAIDWVKVGESIGRLFGFFAKGAQTLPKLLPLLVGLVGVLAGLKFLGPLLGKLGGFGKEGGPLGGIAKGISGLGKTLKGGVSLLAMGAAMLLFAGSLWVLAKAVQEFGKVKWADMAKAGVALLVLAGVMLGIGLLFGGTGPLGAAALAGMLGFSAAVLMLASALWVASKAIQNFDPQHLTDLSKVAQPGFIFGMLKLGAALAALALPMLAVSGLAVIKLIGFGKALKEIALGLYVLSKTPPIKDMTEQIKNINLALQAMSQTHFTGNAKDAGDGFKAITDAMMQLSSLDPAKLAGLSDAMKAASGGIAAWLDTMETKSGKGGILKFLGIAPDLKATADAFKDMALGMYVFGASAKLLPEIQTMMATIPAMMDKVTHSLMDFDKVKDAARTFNDILADMRQSAMAPIQVTANAQGGGATVPVTGNVTNLTGGGTVDLTTSFQQQADKIVAALKDLEGALLDRSNTELNTLGLIARYTKMASHG